MRHLADRSPMHAAALALVALASMLASGAASAACEARSGPKTAALVELYTSEGCSSCPPADKRLSALREALDPAAEVVPISLHVDYWDSIGWKDPFAQAAFGARQSALVAANRNRTVYTPHFFVSGRETRSWQDGLREEVRRVNAQPAAADLRVQAGVTPAGAFAIAAEATSRTPQPGAQLFVALTEDGLVSKVTRGENGGATLAHDGVVREWIGPIALDEGRAQVKREVALDPSWKRDKLAVVAFVQQERAGRVLQAVGTGRCVR